MSEDRDGEVRVFVQYSQVFSASSSYLFTAIPLTNPLHLNRLFSSYPSHFFLVVINSVGEAESRTFFPCCRQGCAF